MCLYSKEKVPLIAEKDIVCYKILRKEEHEYFSPYQDDKIIFNKTIIASRPKREFEIIKEVFPSLYICFAITKGFIHACNTQSEAEFYFTKRIPNNLFIYYNIVKCIIPKESRYFNGICGDICADRMIITDEKII